MVVVYHPILDWNIFGKNFMVDDVLLILLEYFWGKNFVVVMYSPVLD